MALSVVGPLGENLERTNLPPRTTTRWVIRRKAQMVAAVNGGLLSSSEACDLYALTFEELASWQQCLDREGILGLRAKSMQQHRNLRA